MTSRFENEIQKNYITHNAQIFVSVHALFPSNWNTIFSEGIFPEVAADTGYNRVHAVAQFVEALRYKPEGSRVRFPMGSLEFFIDIILPAAI